MAQKSEHCYAGMDTDYEPKDPPEDCVLWEDLMDTLFIQASEVYQCGGAPASCESEVSLLRRPG